MDETNLYDKKRKFFTLKQIILFFAIACTCFALSTWQGYNDPDPNFPISTPIHIAEGTTITQTTQLLEKLNIVRSSLHLYTLLHQDFSDSFVQAGTYTFDKPLTAYEIAQSITEGANRTPHISLTLTEGFRARDLKLQLPDHFSGFSDEELDQYDGVLFPDTYFFSANDTAQDILATLKSTFYEKLSAYDASIKNSGFSSDEIIILASIIEREASDTESKHLVSGILHKRLNEDMPLQVDAVFHYMLHKTSAELTESDLRSDSPFNTYTRKGLPPKPIANPGIDSIEAALNPTPTEFLFYLTDQDGEFHYAKNFEEHKKNKERYLR